VEDALIDNYGDGFYGEFYIQVVAEPRSIIGKLQVWLNGIEVQIISRTSEWLGHRPRFGVHFDAGLDYDVKYPDIANACAGLNILEVSYHSYDEIEMERLWVQYQRSQGRVTRGVVPYGFISDILVENPSMLQLHQDYLPIVFSSDFGLLPCSEELESQRHHWIEENRGS